MAYAVDMDTPIFRTRDVGCSFCGAVAGNPCVTRVGVPAMSHHSERVSYARQVNERVAEDAHFRFRARRRGAPRAVKPCGTRSAAIRHQRHGEELDPACVKALRDWERERSRRRRGAAA